MSDLSIIIRADVLAAAPELSTITDALWVDVLAWVNEFQFFNDSVATKRLARILLAAHIGLTVKRAPSGAAGPVTSEAVGGLRRSYGLMALAAGDEGLGSSIYGQQYMMILGSSNCHGPFLV